MNIEETMIETIHYQTQMRRIKMVTRQNTARTVGEQCESLLIQAHGLHHVVRDKRSSRSRYGSEIIMVDEKQMKHEQKGKI